MRTHVVHHPAIFLQCFFLMREILSQGLDKGLMPLSIAECAVADGHAVESLRIEALPRQIHQTEILEWRIQTVALAESAHIVHASIESHALALVALHTSTGLHLSLKDEHAHALLGKDVATFQATQARSNYDYVVFHFLFNILKRNGWTT